MSESESVLTEIFLPNLEVCNKNFPDLGPPHNFTELIVNLSDSFSYLSPNVKATIERIFANYSVKLGHNAPSVIACQPYINYIMFLLGTCKGLTLLELKSQYIAKRIIIALSKIMDTILTSCIELNFLNIFFTYKGKYYMFQSDKFDSNLFPSLKNNVEIDESTIEFMELVSLLDGCDNMKKILERLENIYKKRKYMPINELFNRQLINFLCFIFEKIGRCHDLKPNFIDILNKFIESRDILNEYDKAILRSMIQILTDMRGGAARPAPDMRGGAARPAPDMRGGAALQRGESASEMFPKWSDILSKIENKDQKGVLLSFIANTGVKIDNFDLLIREALKKSTDVRRRTNLQQILDSIQKIQEDLHSFFGEFVKLREFVKLKKKFLHDNILLEIHNWMKGILDTGIFDFDEFKERADRMKEYVDSFKRFLTDNTKTLQPFQTLKDRLLALKAQGGEPRVEPQVAAGGAGEGAGEGGARAGGAGEEPRVEPRDAALILIQERAGNLMGIIEQIKRMGYYSPPGPPGAAFAASGAASGAAFAALGPALGPAMARRPVKCEPLIKLTDLQVMELTKKEYRQFLVENLDKATLDNFKIDCKEFDCLPLVPLTAQRAEQAAQAEAEAAAQRAEQAQTVAKDKQIEKMTRQIQQYDYLLAHLKEIIKHEKPEIDFTIYHCEIPRARPCINIVFHFDPYDENLSILDSIARIASRLTDLHEKREEADRRARALAAARGAQPTTTAAQPTTAAPPTPAPTETPPKLPETPESPGAEGAEGAEGDGVARAAETGGVSMEQISTTSMIDDYNQLHDKNLILNKEKDMGSALIAIENKTKMEEIQKSLDQLKTLSGNPVYKKDDYTGKFVQILFGGSKISNKNSNKNFNKTNKNHKMKHKMKTLKRTKIKKT